MGPNFIAWNLRKQQIIAYSLSELAFHAIANVAVELRWLHKLLIELGIHLFCPLHVWCDNLGAVFLSSNVAFRVPTRHVKVDYHFIRE